MINPKILEAIESQLTKERFLFWYDTDVEYQDCIRELAVNHAEVIFVDETPALSIKLMVAESAYTQKFLFYSTQPEPEPQHNWLLSYRLKGKSFSADSTQMLLDELGLTTHSLRPHLKLRMKFFGAKERVERLKKWVSPNDNADEIDLKILTVIARADQADAFSIFNQVLSAIVQDDEVYFDSPSRIWAEMLQYQMEDGFWTLAEKLFSYQADNPTLKNLLMCLFVTEFASGLSSNHALPQQLIHFILADSSKANAKVFVSRWRNDVNLMHDFVLLSQAIAAELNIEDLIAVIPAEALYETMTFDAVERRILKTLKDTVILNCGVGCENVVTIITRRKDGFWANLKVAKDSQLTKAYAACYDAIEAAQTFFGLKKQYEAGFSFLNAQLAFNLYQRELFLFDQTYRHFNYAASLVEPMGWPLLHDLRERIESAYSGWFIPQFSSAWGKVVEDEHGLLNHWHIDGCVNQYQFYDKYVQPVLNANVKRVFVLISDAFRYEAAQELCGVLNARNKYQAQLNAMLGVLPSYTSLGMASLLPHQTLAFKRGQNISVLADGLSTSGLDQRTAVLNQYQGVAIKHEDLLALGKEKGREFVKGYQVVYIYHDRVDAIGDKQATETKTFEAVNQTIDELAQIVSFVFNSLSASTLFVTADHGFMYQESALESADKANLLDKPSGTLLAKKRYLIGDKLGSTSQAWFGSTQMTAGTEEGDGSVDFWVPKAANRFHFAGGARFVHGSAMPQEVAVPLITIKQSAIEKSKTKYVSISMLGSVKKVVTNMQRFEFIQTEAVSDYVLARTVRFSIQDNQTPISDEFIVTLDKTSSLMDDRKISIILTLKAGSYDPIKDYHLSARDIESGVEVLREQMRVDLSFTNDF